MISSTQGSANKANHENPCIKMRGTQRQLTRRLANVLKWAPEVTRGVPQECETMNTVTTVAGQ
ncbi:hypothetical protein M405DRAFT_834405 [Rhizopogon salebrosus TDB-379]|nr:hypothetical protein M405DRAFT_834405 [Rhizopogon salebrosus TDB-379]